MIRIIERVPGLIPADSHLIDITNVTKWFYQDSDKEMWDIEEDFPSILPPWPVAWFEYSYPKFSRSGKKIIKMPKVGIDRVGVSTITTEIPEEFSQDAYREDFGIRMLEKWTGKRMVSRNTPGVRKKKIEAALSSGKQCKWITIFCQVVSGKRITKTLGFVVVYHDESGRAFGELHQEVGASFPNFSGSLTPTMFAISLLHCKNVELITMPLSKKRAKMKPYNTGIRYKTLVVEPLKKQIRSESENGKTGIKHALHICRGHFKDYREKGLFGKYRDIYWWDMHARGSKKYGEVKKDYNIDVGT